jgi:hypothetical protein
MRNVLKRITQTMSEIVRRVNSPLRPGTMVGVFEDTICSKIPHVWVRVVEDVLFHTEKGFFGFVFSIAHGAEFGEGFLNGTVAMGTFESGVLPAVLTSTTLMDLFGYN